MNTDTATLYHRDGSRKTFAINEIARMASCGQVGAGKDWSSVVPAPAGWEKIVPKYRARRNIQPAERARYRSEPPFGTGFGSDRWQYGTREIKAGEIIETKDWPHSSFEPLNYGAEKVLDFFNTRAKSRLATSPWFGNGLRLDDGNGPATLVNVVTPKLKPMDPRPVA